MSIIIVINSAYVLYTWRFVHRASSGLAAATLGLAFAACFHYGYSHPTDAAGLMPLALVLGPAWIAAMGFYAADIKRSRRDGTLTVTGQGPMRAGLAAAALTLAVLAAGILTHRPLI